MLRHDFITLRDGMEYYQLNEKPMIRMAREAGSVYKIGKMVRVRRVILEAYLREIMKRSPNEKQNKENEDMR